MKKVLLICGIASIFLALTSPALAQEPIPPEENAATYYNKAFELMKDWPSKDATTRARKITKEGWRENDKELEQFLKENQSAFEEFRKGVAKEKCQFIEGEITFDTLLPHLAKVRNLARLLILEARLYERNGNLEKAITNSLDVIKLGHDLGRDRILISKLVDVAIFNISYPALKDLARSDKLTPALARKTISKMLELQERSVSMRETLEGEAACMKLALRKLLKQVRMEREGKIKVGAPSDGGINELKEVIAKLDDRLAHKVLEETFLIIDKYFATLVSHLEKRGCSHSAEMAENFYTTMSIELNLEISLYGDNHMQIAPQDQPKIMPKILACMLLPAISRFPLEVGKADARSRGIITLLAVRLFKMERGRYPQSLDELVPQYLDEVPLDPFDLKPLRYRKRQGKWIIYSIGPDGKDDGGVKNYVRREAEEGADLIFEVE